MRTVWSASLTEAGGRDEHAPEGGPRRRFQSHPRADKLKAKQDLDPVQGRSIAATAASDENTPETTADGIVQMRHARE